MSINVKALSAFKKLGAVALMVATTLALAGLSTSCKQTPTPTPKHAITFGVDGANGTLTAKVDGMAETDKSPITVEEGKTVTFKAKANDGYRVKGWTLDGKPITEAGTNTEYKLKVSKAATVKVSFELNPVKGGAVFILSPDKLNIKLTAKTADGSAITVEGCNETTLTSDVETTLNATGTRVVLKGKIIELKCDYNQLTELNVQGLTALQRLKCYYNQLTELNVQGLTALQMLECHSNKINAEEMTKLLNALPTREASDGAKAVLYTEQTVIPEGNHKDFTQPAELKKAFEDAKKRNWKLQKINASGSLEDI